MKNPASARKWVVISALVVAGIWGYRRYREGPLSVLQFPEFIAAWGAVYFTLAMITEAAPRFGGSFSILIMVADVLQNARPGDQQHGLLADLNQQVGKAKSTPSPSTTASASPTVQTHLGAPTLRPAAAAH